MQNVTGALRATAPFVGNISDVVSNTQDLYEGDLKRYFQAFFKNAKNLNHPYHNFRHMTHVMWLCYCACDFYRKELTGRQMRNLLIAALFHDFNHSGKMGNDSANIKRAVAGLKKHIAEEDKPYFKDIVALIKETEYPPKTDGSDLSLSAQILRDADLSQAFSVAWIQQVIFGLAKEWKKEPIEVLRMQESFLRGVTLLTEWGRQTFTHGDVENKIKEARQILKILE